MTAIAAASAAANEPALPPAEKVAALIARPKRFELLKHSTVSREDMQQKRDIYATNSLC